MIDGIKFTLNPDIIRNSDVLEFRRVSTGRDEAKYKGFSIKLYSDSCYVSGSIHKYKNNGEHNADDFRLSEFIQALNDLATTLNFNPEAVSFYSLEFGVNVELSFDAHIFIDSVVYYNNGILTSNRQGIEFQFADYAVKVYLKDKDKNLLRYEISINKTRKVKKIVEEDATYCNTLADLTSPIIWHSFGKELLNVFDSLLIVDKDSIDIQSLNADDIRLYVNGISSGYWLRNWETRTLKQRSLNRFREIVSKHSTSTMKEDVKGLISGKINSLIDIEDVLISPFENVTISPFEKLKTEGEDVTISPFEKLQTPTGNVLRFHHLRTKQPDDKKGSFCYDFPTWMTGENVTKPTPQNRLCKVTGLSLEIGIKQGEYLSPKGVEFYYNNHPDIFAEKLYPRLSKKWQTEPLKIQFREIAHSIRNGIYNPKHNFKRDIKNLEEPGMSWLFSMAETIRPENGEYL